MLPLSASGKQAQPGIACLRGPLPWRDAARTSNHRRCIAGETIHWIRDQVRFSERAGGLEGYRQKLGMALLIRLAAIGFDRGDHRNVADGFLEMLILRLLVDTLNGVLVRRSGQA